MNKRVLREVKLAYLDCWSDYKQSKSLQELDFMASDFLPPSEVKAILKEAIPHGLRKFDTSCVDLFSADCMIKIAREKGVCFYVKGNKMPPSSTLASRDHQMLNGITRISWD